MPKVLNKYRDTIPAGAVYIGRPSRWGNPFKIGDGCTREQAVAKYREWIMSESGLVAAVRRELAGKDLVCFCSPKPCHGDVLLAIANHPCLLEDGTYDHDWEWKSDWYGDPGVIGGTADCSCYRCRVCGEEDWESDPPTMDDDIV